MARGQIQYLYTNIQTLVLTCRKTGKTKFQNNKNRNVLHKFPTRIHNKPVIGFGLILTKIRSS